jgi:hypothetical protein
MTMDIATKTSTPVSIGGRGGMNQSQTAKPSDHDVSGSMRLGMSMIGRDENDDEEDNNFLNFSFTNLPYLQEMNKHKIEQYERDGGESDIDSSEDTSSPRKMKKAARRRSSASSNGSTSNRSSRGKSNRSPQHGREDILEQS